MPWIQVLCSPDSNQPGQQESVAGAVGEAAASALSLDRSDVLVFTIPSGVPATGALVTVVGRDRGSEQEARLRTAIVEAVCQSLDVEDGVVGFVRNPGN